MWRIRSNLKKNLTMSPPQGFGGATLLLVQPEKTAELLEKVMGHELIGKEGDFIRFRSEQALEML